MEDINVDIKSWRCRDVYLKSRNIKKIPSTKPPYMIPNFVNRDFNIIQMAYKKILG